MDSSNNSPSRRDFLRQTSLIAGGLFVGAARLSAIPLLSSGTTAKALPQRILGKTRAPVSALSLDTAPCGLSTAVSTRQIADIVNAALDQGINFIDSARTSGRAEEGIGMALGRRRRETFLSTKVWADTPADAERSLAASLRSLKTDYVDLLYFHNLGTRGFEESTGPDGVFTWLLKQKQAGKIRFVGISGYNLSERFPAYIRTDQIDVIMMVMNFVDRHIYAFEEKILPLARDHNLGVVAMKVFGGVRGGLGAHIGQRPVPQMPEEYLELAVRYVLNLPGVTTANIGVYDADQLRKNIARVEKFKPITPREQNLLDVAGCKLAAQWRPHFGPIMSYPPIVECHENNVVFSV